MNKVENIFQDVVTALKPLKKAEYRSLGLKAGLDRTTIGKIASGKATNPTKDVLNKLHNVLFHEALPVDKDEKQ